MQMIEVKLSKADLTLLVYLVGDFLATLRMAGVGEEVEARADAEELYQRLTDALQLNPD